MTRTRKHTVRRHRRRAHGAHGNYVVVSAHTRASANRSAGGDLTAPIDATSGLAFDAFNTALAKALSRLKKDAHAETVRQNYKGTGSQKAVRQIWVRFTNGAVVDLWLQHGYLGFGGVVVRGGATPLPKGIKYSGRTVDQVYQEALSILQPWANPVGLANQAVVRTHATHATRATTNRARGNTAQVKKVQKYADQVRRDLHFLGIDTGYVLFANMGPYDHNPYDVPLPMEEHPRVFRALYEAVDYAQSMKGWGKVKISRVDGTAVTGRPQLSSTVVWKSWTTSHGGWKE